MKVTALIVTYNRLNKLKRCMAATLALDFSSVVVVNNASTDDTSSWLETINDPRLIIINEANNTGGAGGFYTGSSYICENLETDWVFFYDDDAYPERNLLKNFETISCESNAAYASLVTDLSGEVCSMNIPFTKIPYTTLELIEYSCSKKKYVPCITKSEKVATLSFVGACINKQVLTQKLHSIRSELFIYYDDLYFGFDLSSNDLNIRFSPELLFKHDVSQKEGGIYPEWKVYYLIRNLLLSLKIYKTTRPYSKLSIIFRVMKYFILSLKQKNKLKYIKYCVKACFHGLTGITGKQH
ncbi:glycosyltransferase [Klebsiella aerogenes]|uniref:glycosyltransferase n=1 Tax=Klebsiella aerogenes TaxID=548 RepID=UPI00397CD034